MNNRRTQLRFRQNGQNGAVLPLVAICFILLVSFAALAIDLGYLFVGRNELQNAADAAALGATRQLSAIYQDMDKATQVAYDVTVDNAWTADDGEGRTTDDQTIIYSAAEVASRNKATQDDIIIDSADVEIGVWTSGSFSTQNIRPTAVRVTARRNSDNVSGPIATFFSGVFGPNSFPVSATATASLTGKGTASEAELELPIGVSRKWFDGPPSDWCGDIVKFSPTTDPEACAGWTTFKYDPANDVKIRKILLPEDDNQHLVSPANEVNDIFEFTNGDLSEGSFENLLAEHQRKGFDVDKVHDPDAFDFDPDNYSFPVSIEDENGNITGSQVPLCTYYNATTLEDKIQACNPGDEYVDEANPGIQLRYPPCSGASGCSGPPRFAHEWKTTIIVYDSDDCTPSGSMPILGYANVVVFNVGYPSYKVVQARIECDLIDNEDNRGGGSDFGILGSIPGLVE